MVHLLALATSPAAAMPLRSLSWSVDVTGPLAMVTVDATFHADADHPVDATWLFPVPPDAVVDGMRMRIGDRVVESRVDAKEQARATFEEARASGRSAALTEQSRPNLFVQDVANVPPGQDIEVELRLVQPVARVEGAWELVVPLVVAPRFVSGEDREGAGEFLADRLEAGGPTGVPTDVELEVDAGLPILELWSDSHDLRPTVALSTASASLRGISPTRDLVVRWRTADREPAMVVLASDDTAMLLVEPPRDTPREDRAPREITWVVDTSCSMRGRKLDLAKDLVRRALVDAGPDDAFDLVTFASGVRVLWDAPRTLGGGGRQQALAAVDELAALGTTDLWRALDAALSLPHDPRRRRVIVFLTDGQITNEPQVLARLAGATDATVSTIGFGAAPNRYVLDEMARLGGGTASYATLEDPEIELPRLIEATDRAVIGDLEVDWRSCRATGLAPARIPDLLPRRAIRVLAHVGPDCSGTVLVTARTADGPRRWYVPVVRAHDPRAMASTWARERVADLERRSLTGDLGDVSAEVESIGLQYGIVTSRTSRVAVDQEEREQREEPVVSAEDRADDNVLHEAEEDGKRRAEEVDRDAEIEPSFHARPEGTVELDADEPPISIRSTTTGEVLTKDLLERVPTTRTFSSTEQAAPGTIAGAAGMPSAGPGADVPPAVGGGYAPLEPAISQESVLVIEEAPFPYPSVTVPATDGFGRAPRFRSSGSDDLGFELGGAWVGGGDQREPTGRAALAGPLVHDRLWFGVDTDLADQRFADRDLASVRGGARFDAQPSPAHRLALAADLGTSAIEEATLRSGRGLAEWRASSSHTDLELRGELDARALDDASRRRTDVTADLRADVAPHEIALGVAAASTDWTGHGGWTWLGGAVDDAWALRWFRLSLGSGLLVPVSGGPVVGTPRAGLAWSARDRFRIELGGQRTVDPIAAPPADLARPGTTDRVGALASVEVVPDLGLDLSADGYRERLPFALPWWADPVPDQVPEVQRDRFELAVGLRKIEARRWSAGARWRWAVADAGDPTLLHDPIAPFVPGFLDAWREHRVEARFAWRAPLDPWTLTVQGSAEVGTAIDEALGAASTLWLGVAQRIPVRRGALEASARVGRVDDPAAIPVELIAVDPTTPTVAPLRAEGGLLYRF